jgi:hypothetical protein
MIAANSYFFNLFGSLKHISTRNYALFVKTHALKFLVITSLKFFLKTNNIDKRLFAKTF